MVSAELREAAVLLGATGLVAVLAHRLRVSTLLGFLLVGVLVGPHVLGQLVAFWPPLAHLAITDMAAVRVAAELGVAFLLFMIGLELSLDRLWQMRDLVLRLGGAQVLVTGALIGFAAAQFGTGITVAMVLGAALALSSTAIVMQLLAERGRLGTPLGRTAFGILLLQDLAVVPILFLVGVLGGGAAADGGVARGVLEAFGRAALAIGAILVAGRLLLRPVLRAVAKTGSREAFLAAILLTILATAALTEAAGLSLALGAFLAGLLFAETEFRPQIAVDLEPFKGLLLGVFFVSVGLSLDLAGLLAAPLTVGGAALGLVVLKALVLYALIRVMGESRGVAAEGALLLAQAGEFAFIVVALALGLGLIPPATAAFVTLVAGLTMMLTPGLASLGRRLGRRLDGPAAGPTLPVDAPPGEALQGHVIIAGYGRVGRLVGELLDSQRIPHVAADLQPVRVARLRSEGAAVYYGDAARTEVLAALGAAHAAALVITMDRPETVAAVVRAVHAAWPGLPIHTRVREEADARALRRAGASEVVPEVTEAGLQLGEGVLCALGVPDEAARRAVDQERLRRRASLA
jgi:CPA2 family monovalent cation:H+ antiporter-2